MTESLDLNKHGTQDGDYLEDPSREGVPSDLRLIKTISNASGIVKNIIFKDVYGQERPILLEKNLFKEDGDV